MTMIIRNNKVYAGSGGGSGNANIVKVTQAEYDALPESKNSDCVLYAITDGESQSAGEDADMVIYTEEDGSKTTVQDKLSELNSKTDVKNGDYTFAHQGDGNFVIYDMNNNAIFDTKSTDLKIDELNSNITMILQGNATSENGVETIACPSNSTFTHTVSFSKPFNTIPTIICTCKNNYGGGYSVPVTVNEITKGGFICTIGATGGGGTEVYLTWNATADVAS